MNPWRIITAFFVSMPPASWTKGKVAWWFRNPGGYLFDVLWRLGPGYSIQLLWPHKIKDLPAKWPTFWPDGGFMLIKHSQPDWPTRYFISYRGAHIEAYFGWRPDGAFGIALRHSHARNAPG